MELPPPPPPHPLYNHLLWVIGESNSSLIKICKLSKTILSTLAPFQHGYRSSVLILHRSFPNVYNLSFTSSKNSNLVSISNLPFGFSYFSTRRLFRLIYVELRFENILYFLQTEDNICNQGIFELQTEDNICNQGIFLGEARLGKYDYRLRQFLKLGRRCIIVRGRN